MTRIEQEMTAVAVPATPDGTRRRSSDPLLERFPPRTVPAEWPATRLTGPELLQRLLAGPFVTDHDAAEENRRRGLRIVLRWLEGQPGITWQQRWVASGADDDGRVDWRSFPLRWAKDTKAPLRSFDEKVMTSGLLSVVCADAIRPSLDWLLTTATPKRWAAEMARTRDPAGFAALTARSELRPVGESSTGVAMHRIAVLIAAKGGLTTDITPGDCLQLLRLAAKVCTVPHYRSSYFYQLLHAVGVFGESAAPSVSALTAQRQLSVEQLIDRCGIESRPVRDLLVEYLRERQISVDHVSLVRLADVLGRLFWRDLELHHPGISSLRLPPAVTGSWKQRVLTKTTRRTRPDGSTEEVRSSRKSATGCLSTVRGFYLDIAQWATDDPALWGPWAVPCPIKTGKIRSQAGSGSAQVTDGPADPGTTTCPACLDRRGGQRAAEDPPELLAAARATEPGELFTVGGLDAASLGQRPPPRRRIWAEDPVGGKRRDLTRA